jgi:hypothetical protein
MAVQPVPEKKSSCLKILLGCAIALVVLCGGGGILVVVAFPKLKEWVQNQWTKIVEWEEFAQTWNPPPADADPDRLFPAQVADFHRQDINKDPAPQMGINLAGSQATYQKGADTMEVFAYRANIAEKNAAFQQFEAAQQKEPNKWNVRMETSSHTRFAFSRGPEHGVLWWSQGWLFLVRTTGTADPEEFLKSYLTAIADHDHGPPKPEKPAQPEKTATKPDKATKPEKPAKGGGDF